MKAGKSDIATGGHQEELSGNSRGGTNVAIFRWDFYYCETSVLHLRPSVGWMRSTHIIEGHLLSLKLTDCRC